MLRRFLLLILLPIAVAQGADDPGALLRKLRTARSYGVPEKLRLEVAESAMVHLRKKTAAAFPGVKTAVELYEAFARDPEAMKTLEKGLGPIETDIYTELTNLFDQIQLERRVDSCYFATGGREIGEELKRGAADFDPVCNNEFRRKIIVYSGFAKGEFKPSTVNVPLFAFPRELEYALTATQHKAFKENYEAEPPWRPEFGVIEAMVEPDADDRKKAELIATLNLRRDAFERASIKALRTKISTLLRYGFKAPYSESTVHGAVASQIDAHCKDLCTEKQRKAMARVLDREFRSATRAGLLQESNPTQVRDATCKALKEASYPFDEDEEAARIHAHETIPMGAIDHPSMADTHIAGIMDALYARRRAILGSLVQSGGDGALILTKKLTRLEEQSPGHIRLKCRPDSAAEDLQIARQAIQEAGSKTEEFLDKLRKNVSTLPDGAKGFSYVPKDVAERNKELLKLSPKAFGEALMRNGALENKAVCELAEAVMREDLHEQDMDLLKAWGAGALGIGLMFTGYGAAVGSKLMYTSLALGAVLATGVAADQLIEASESREISEALRGAAIAQGGDAWVLKESKAAWQRYNELKWHAILSLGMAAADWAPLVRVAAKTSIQRLKPTRRLVGGKRSLELDELTASLRAEVEKAREEAARLAAGQAEKDAAWSSFRNESSPDVPLVKKPARSPEQLEREISATNLKLKEMDDEIARASSALKTETDKLGMTEKQFEKALAENPSDPRFASAKAARDKRKKLIDAKKEPFERMLALNKEKMEFEVFPGRRDLFNGSKNELELTQNYLQRLGITQAQLIEKAPTWKFVKVPKFTSEGARPTRLATKDINFMQNNLQNTFSDGTHTVIENALAIKEGTLNPNTMGAIRVWRDTDGNIWSLDHRRLAQSVLGGQKEVRVEWVGQRIVERDLYKFGAPPRSPDIYLRTDNGKVLKIPIPRSN